MLYVVFVVVVWCSGSGTCSCLSIYLSICELESEAILGDFLNFQADNIKNDYYLLLPPTTYYLLPTIYYLLYLLPTTYYLLPTIYYLLSTIYYLLLLLLLLLHLLHTLKNVAYILGTAPHLKKAVMLHYTNYTAVHYIYPQLQLQLPLHYARLHYTTLITLQLQLQLHYFTLH